MYSICNKLLTSKILSMKCLNNFFTMVNIFHKEKICPNSFNI